jgi:hypothetical protein
MFILRKLTGDGVQFNFTLGSQYTYVDRFASPEDFRRTFKHYYQKDHVADMDPQSDDDTKRCYGFVSNENGDTIHPLHFNQSAYIMTEYGGTFSNLTM